VRRALLLISLASCGQGDPASCRLDPFAEADLKDQTPTDCGAFTLDANGGFSAASMQAAHGCVLDAIAHAHAFNLFYDVGDPSRHLRAGFTGSVDASGTLHEKAYAYVGDSLNGSGDSRPVLTVETCGSIEATAAGCMPMAGIPCLGCANPGPLVTLCRF
jgi:hypothetical protein